jgi:hypothetical protein
MEAFTLMWDVLKDLRSGGFVQNYETFLKRLLKDIFREVEAFFKLI